VTSDQGRVRPPRRWTVKVRLVIEAADADAARAISEEVLQKMGVVVGAEPQLRKPDSPEPSWYVVTELDLSGLGSITPDDAPTRFKFVIRELPGVSFAGRGDVHSGLWEWLRDSWGAAGQPLFPHPAVRAAGIYISDGAARHME
jgi:hypothetical protein